MNTFFSKIDDKKKSTRRISLKWKWTIGTAVAIFLAYTLFSSILYFGFERMMLENERENLQEMTATVSERLIIFSGPLTEEDILSAINPTPDNEEDSVNPSLGQGNLPIGENVPYQESLFSRINSEGIVIRVYNDQNRLVYESVPSDRTRIITEQFEIETLQLNRRTILSASTPVYSSMNNEKIGNVQIIDELVAFHELTDRVLFAIVVTGIIALVFSGIFGFLLALNFLNPIRKMTAAINVIRKDPQSEERIDVGGGNDELTELANAYNDMLDRMQRNIENQKLFVEDVSHELRTPVAVVEGHLKLLNRWGKDDPEVLEESLEASLQEIGRMKKLVQEMLDLSRAEQVEIHYKNESTPLREVIMQTVNNFRMIHEDFIFNLDDATEKEINVSIYRNHLEQILIILLDNAVKYSRDRKEVHVSIATEGTTAQIAIQDFGEGMSEEDTEKIFNRFYRIDKARSRHKGGNGLGLSIAKELIQGYGGKIWAESVLNYGSVFRIILPITEGDSDKKTTNKAE
ncbi:HAMP domain-containing sensor histidine kinase [Lacticigenium naphthae]|uniref:HAMP domain-containing sensor histidine kinase n=1 Tax=Lacticigenium naphthae TaxID=515351 RepID=UPI000429EDD2|nr:HAMP domain-containing histidine kinase [Lacticigenium naphthae]